MEDRLLLNIGCGARPLMGWVNLDMADIPGVDVVHDLDQFPWPFPDGEAEGIRAFDVFEHVNDPIGFVAECWRILRPGGMLEIHTSYWKSENSYTDPTHKRFCTERTFDYWCVGTEYFERYGPMYARGCSFLKLMAQVDGQELSFLLRKQPEE